MDGSCFLALRAAGSLGLMDLGTWEVGSPSCVALDLVLAPVRELRPGLLWQKLWPACGRISESGY